MCLLAFSSLYFLHLIKANPKFEYDAKSSKYIVQIGKWNGLESLVRNVGYIIGVVAVVNFIGQYEPDAIGGYNTAMWVMWCITLIPVSAWVEATQIAIGNAYGQSDLQAMKDIQKISTIILSLYMIAWIFLGWAFWLPISRWLNQGVSDNVVQYSMLTFMYLIWPYILYTVGQGLKTVFIGTGRPQYVLIPSAIVNIFIYLPLGLMVKYSGLAVSYTQFLSVSISVFALDFALTCYYLWKKGYMLDFHAFE